MNKYNIIFQLIEKEKKRQKEGLELIASENFVSNQVMEAMGSILTNKYAEGLPHKRYYGGCETVDEIEDLARENAKKLFGVDWVNVQPHSGSQANASVYLALLNPGDKILGFNLSHGGHLTHGSSVNFSGKIYNPSFYGVDEKTGVIDMNKVEEIAKKENPKLIICGASAYSRDWDYKAFSEIAKKVGALLLADIAHTAGLIAKKTLNNPFPYCDVITTTTHKTLRGPRGGMIMIGKDFENPLGIKTLKGKTKMMSQVLDSSVFPGTQGGPLVHVIAAKAVAFNEALEPSFNEYILQVQKNAKAMADSFINKGYKLISEGTDNHLMLIDLTNKGITGKDAEIVLDKAGITTNKNMIPFDTKTPFITSGIRIGTPAITTRGLNEEDSIKVVEYIDRAIKEKDNYDNLSRIKIEIKDWISNFPLFAWD